MGQYLLVEGKDYFAIGELCKAHFPLPKGFNQRNQREFLKGGKGFEETLIDFVNVFDTPNLKNIGIVLDADFKGVEKRFRYILSALSDKLKHDFDTIKLSNEGVSFSYKDIKIGIWIMPNNQNDGYLEHFIETMIDEKDDILIEVKEKINELMTKNYCRFTKFKTQKAIVYNWLAWQETPGLPFGTAMTAGLLNTKSESVKPFLNWIKNTFEF
jgi:hypothetical protein